VPRLLLSLSILAPLACTTPAQSKDRPPDADAAKPELAAPEAEAREADDDPQAPKPAAQGESSTEGEAGPADPRWCDPRASHSAALRAGECECEFSRCDDLCCGEGEVCVHPAKPGGWSKCRRIRRPR
jgi:hypothetical protein